jgi:hypothetical protein
VLISLAPILGGLVTAFSIGVRGGAPFGALGFVLGMLVMAGIMLSPTRISIGADGILTRWLGRRRFHAFSETDRVDPIEKRLSNKTYLFVQLTKKNGEQVNLPIGQKRWSEDDFAAVNERIREAIEVYKSGRIEANASALERKGRAPADWIVALRAVGAGANADMRTAPVSGEQLLRILEDPGAEPRARASAAVALSARGSEEDNQRIRIAADATAAPKLRIVLQKVTEPEASDEELGAMLAELEATEAS